MKLLPNHSFGEAFAYWRGIIGRRINAARATRGHQVHFYNWCRVWPQDFWLVDFIEKRGLLAGRPRLQVGLYSIFAPMWLSRFDRSDLRLFVERENLHKRTMQRWQHRFLDDARIDLSLGFDRLDHPQYLHFPFWLMWNIFPPTATAADIRQAIARMESPDNHSYTDRHFCAFVCSHDDVGRRQMLDQLAQVGPVHCDGRQFHNNDDLKTLYADDKLAYLRHYRFNLTPENTDHEGYVTEKLFEAISSGCVPLYQGGGGHPEPDVLNPDAILFVKMGADNADVLQRVADLNASADRYLEFARQPRFVAGAADVIWGYYEQLEQRLRTLISNL